jgi:hypothetical protein
LPPWRWRSRTPTQRSASLLAPVLGLRWSHAYKLSMSCWSSGALNNRGAFERYAMSVGQYWKHQFCPNCTSSGLATSSGCVVWFQTLPWWVSESMTEQYKSCNISKIVIAISHPDQWGFWEWLGQTPRSRSFPTTTTDIRSMQDKDIRSMQPPRDG